MTDRTLPLRRFGLAGAWMVGVVAWWGVARGGDPDILFANDTRLESSRLLEAVLARNPDLPAQRAAWEAARARIAQAGALDDPMLSYTIAPQTLGASGLDFGHKFRVSQRLPWPGKRALRRDVARFEADAAQEAIAGVRLRLIEETQVAYADWYYVHAAIRVNQVNKSLLEEFRDIAQIKYAAGRASKQDALRAEVEVALLEHRDVVLERRRAEVRAVLNTLLQRQPDASLPPPGGLLPVTGLPAVESLRAAALESHPALRVLAERIEGARRRLALADRDFFPDIQLAVGYNWLWNRTEKRFTVSAGVPIPLAGKRRAAKDEARAGLIRLGLEQRSQAAEVLGVLQQAYDRVRESMHAITLYRERLLPLAEETLAAAKSDYEAGSGDFLALITAEKNLMVTQLQLETARADYHRHRARLARVAGGTPVLAGVGEKEVSP